MSKYNIASAGNLPLERVLRDMASQLGFGLVGNIYLVMTSATEPNYNVWVEQNKKYDDGSEMIQSTIEAAYAETLTNRNDVIFISSNGTSNKLAAMLTVANNRVHFVGLDPNPRKIGARSLISNTGTGAATDTAMVKVTGTGCSFHNLSLKNNWTAAENLSCVCDWGIQTYWENCDIENLGATDLANELSADLILGGNEIIYNNCTIGQDTSLETSTAGQEILIQNRGSSATKATRDRFDNCRIQCYTSDTTHVFVRAGAVSIDRNITFEDCEFANVIGATSAATLAMAFTTSTTVGGGINIGYPRIFGATNVATSGASTGILLVAPVNAASDAGAVTPS
jgi:hypothetical protein